MNDCLFCKMIAGKIPVQFIYADNNMIALNDINPQAPLHALIIPRRHIPTLNDVQGEDADLLGKMLLVAKRIANEAGVAEAGYRAIFNCNAQAGQTIFHLHLHVLGGRALCWPPG